LLLALLFVALSVLADPPEKRLINNTISYPAIDENTGNFLPDTVNVFEIAKEVSQIFSEAVKYTSLHDVYGDTAYLRTLFTTNYASNDVAEAYKNDVNARIRSQRGDIGVDFSADYAENFRPGFSFDEDIYYKRRFYFGMEWNVIKGGFLASRVKIGQLKKEYQLKDIDAGKRADAENYRYIFNYINYIFNQQKIEVLKERFSLIDQQLKFTTELYHLRYIGWERVLKIRAKLEDLDQQIAQLENFNQHIPNNIPDLLLDSEYSAEDLPLVDIDLAKLMRIYHNNETTDTIAAIKLAMYSGGMKWWQDISLKPYLRYNVYLDEFNFARPYGSAGVSLRVPLRIKNKGNLVNAQKQIYKAEGMSEFQAGDNELVNHYADFAFKLKQIKDFYYKKLLADELIRKELVKKDYKDLGFNPIFTLGLIDDKKSIEAEIIDIKKMLYKQLVQMAFYLDKKSPLSFVEILNPSDFTSRYSTGVQVFVDKVTFETMENNELVNYLWKNEFRDVILEIDSWALSPKVIDAIDKASHDHIHFTLSVKIPEGENYPDVNTDLQEINNIDKTYVNGLHYSLQLSQNSLVAREIQEINFSDWIDGIDIGQKPDNIRLSITISDNLPMNILNKIYNKFDLVFVPSDGTPNRRNLEDRLIQELSLGKNKLTVILDANDFADRLHIENYIANINAETGVENFAFSNVKTMIHADLRTFEMGENSIASEDIMGAFRNQIFADEQKTKEILQARLDNINRIIQENTKLFETGNDQGISIEITDSRTTSQNSQTEVTNRIFTNSAGKSRQIQIAASKVPLSDQFLKNKFNTNNPISMYRVNGYYKYTIGNYTTENKANDALIKYKLSSGNSGAFLVNYKENK
jgi:hypothetical protein